MANHCVEKGCPLCGRVWCTRCGEDYGEHKGLAKVFELKRLGKLSKKDRKKYVDKYGWRAGKSPEICNKCWNMGPTTRLGAVT